MTLGPRVQSFQVGWTKGPRVAESPTACPLGPALEVDSGMLWDPPACSSASWEASAGPAAWLQLLTPVDLYQYLA